jgi:hypothetical protein
LDDEDALVDVAVGVRMFQDVEQVAALEPNKNGLKSSISGPFCDSRQP